MECLYVFIDESGNLDFGPKGTNYFVLSAIIVTDPVSSSQPMQELRYRLMKNGKGGNEYDYFHASEDLQNTRDYVFEVLGQLSNVVLSYVIAEKKYVSDEFKNQKIYSVLGLALIKHILTKHLKHNLKKIILIFDKALSRKEQDNFQKYIKSILRKTKKPFVIYFHRTLVDFNSQIADYCAWAKYVSLERGEYRPMKSLGFLNSETIRVFTENVQ